MTQFTVGGGGGGMQYCPLQLLVQGGSKRANKVGEAHDVQTTL